jgi:hypothetical protein
MAIFDDKNLELTETCKKYPAGRNKTLIIKTVRNKKVVKRKNKNRLCLVHIASNPRDISLVTLKQSDKNYSLWLYPEGRQVNSLDELRLLSSLLAWRIFKKNRYWTGRATKMLGISNLSTKLVSRKSFRLTEPTIVDAVNYQYARICRKYLKAGNDVNAANLTEQEIKYREDVDSVYKKHIHKKIKSGKI